MTKSTAIEDNSCSEEQKSKNHLGSNQKETTEKITLEDEVDICSENSESQETDFVNDGNSNFGGFGFSDELLKTLANKGYQDPTPIQKAAFPELMLGRDLVGQAQTGTGKTAAFALPIIEKLNTPQGPPQVLVLTPTRELAIQVADSFRLYAIDKPELKILSVYGGSDFRSQINALRRGVSIVVGTPGRVMDHLRQGTINKSQLNCLVLDEADEMLRMGFIDDVEWILEQLPEERQMILFSATMPPEIRRISKQYLNDPAEITIKATKQKTSLIRQRHIIVQNAYKINALKRVLEAISEAGVIIFTRTKAITLTVAERLEAYGHNVAVLNGDVPQNQRERTIERLRKGTIDILVATDVAARGLDVDRIGLVINFDMPFDKEAYIHRIGRTGRAGRTGEAILFANPRERSFINNLERAVGQPIERMEIPSNEVINTNRISKLQNNLTKASSQGREHEEETLILKELIKKVEEELEIDGNEIAFAAISLALGPSPLMIQEDETWIKQSDFGRRRNESKEDRGRNGRRGKFGKDSVERNMERFRVEVGYRDNVKPGNLVGAIANETGLKGRMIGKIQIFENHSFIDLPKKMPQDIFDNLKRVKVMNRELQINRST
tara:strand:- start:974 stop:2809 length:1836 start_codon:yes stop_codon:yes gene_type:complete